MFRQAVPLDQVRHNDLPSYVAEGYGGKPLTAWPVTQFYTDYLAGGEAEATEAYCTWYEEQLEKHATIPKVAGGMQHGSLYSLIEKSTGKPFAATSKAERRGVIEERVKQRFALLESMKAHGYNVDQAERIYAVRKQGHVYFTGGHHRAAALLVLGETVIPDVFVFPNQFVYNVFCYVRNLKKYVSFQF